MSDPQLTPRAAPQQARSRATRDHILRVSATLLAEVGVEGFNTNLLAERAGVSPRAIYRYFPNKFAVMVMLTEQQAALERDWMGDLTALGRLGDWRLGVEATIDGFYRGARQWTGYTALRAAGQAVPQLRDVNLASQQRLQSDLAAGLTALGVQLPPPQLEALCRTIVESATRILDLAIAAGGRDGDLLVAELKRMIVALLADHLKPSHA